MLESNCFDLRKKAEQYILSIFLSYLSLREYENSAVSMVFSHKMSENRCHYLIISSVSLMKLKSKTKQSPKHFKQPVQVIFTDKIISVNSKIRNQNKPMRRKSNMSKN